MLKLSAGVYRFLSILVCLSLLNLPSLFAPVNIANAVSAYIALNSSLSQSTHTIQITDSGFNPSQLEIVVGDSVTWQNKTQTTFILQSGTPPTGNTVYMPIIVRGSSVEAESNSSQPQQEVVTPASTDADDFKQTLAPGASFAHTYSKTGTYNFYLVSSPKSPGTVIVKPVDNSLKLLPIGNQTALLGSTLTVQMNTSGGEPTRLFSVEPLPLPPNVTFDSKLGRFSFHPAEEQIGTYTLTFAVSDGKTKASETVVVTVPTPNPNGITAVSGRILDANMADKKSSVPLVGATVRDLDTGQSTKTDSNGSFTLSGLAPGDHYLEFDGSTANPPGTYGGYRSETYLIAHVTNTIDRPIYIMKIDKAGEVLVNPTGNTFVHNPNVNVTVTVPSQAVVNDQGNTYVGPISVSPVPTNFTPAALPDFLDPSMVLTVQPMGLRFLQPAPITFENKDRLPKGSEVDIWSLDHELGVFFIAGRGRVSDDEKRIETLPGGGLREASWHFILPLLPRGGGANDGQGGTKPDCGQSCCVAAKSLFNLANGCVESSFSLPSYVSLGESRGLEFTYLSDRAFPAPVIPFEATLPALAALPSRIEYGFKDFGGLTSAGGTPIGNPVIWKTQGLDENKDEPVRGALGLNQVAGVLPTGIYNYTIRLTSDYGSSRVSADIRDSYMLVNEQNSPFGSGWSISGLQRLYVQKDKDVLLVNGNGSNLHFDSQNVLFEDDFEIENNGQFLNNYAPLLNWNITRGTVDLFGNGQYTAPDHGLYLDLDGSNGVAGRIESASTFLLAPGKYQLSFSMGNTDDPQNRENSVQVNLGNVYSETFRLLGYTPFTEIERSIDVSQPTSATLVFDQSGGDYYGIILDNVKLERTESSSVVGNFPTVSLAVDGRVNIFGAGHRTMTPVAGSGGFRPPAIQFPNGENRAITFSNITGEVSCRSNSYPNGADGGICPGPGSWPTDVQSFTGISGISHDKTMFLTGVFLDDSEPFDPAPPRLDFKGNSDFAELSPSINQTFFIGDGKTSSGVIQRFKLPPGANRLMLGFVDAFNFVGMPSYYDDNTGSLSVELSLSVNANDNEAYQSPAGDYSLLSRNKDGTYTRRMKDGTVYHFDSNGLQKAMVDRNGNTTTYDYTNGLLTSITDPAKLITKLIYDNGRLRQVIDPMERTTTFAHNGAGDLTSISFPDTTSQSYEYENHLLKKETDRRGFSRIGTYDEFGHLIKAELPGDVTRNLAYSQKEGIAKPGTGTAEFPAEIIRPNAAKGSVTDGAGHTTTYTVNQLGQANSITDPAGFTTVIERDVNGNPLKTTTPSGNISENSYDNLGNLAISKDSAVQSKMQYTYDSTFSQPTSSIDSFGNITNLNYDAKGNLIKITSPLGRTMRFEYNSAGLPTLMVDPLGTQGVLNYNNLGNPTEMVLGLGAEARRMTFGYTDEGYLQSMSDPLSRPFNYAYDPFGRLKSEALPGNRTITYDYDNNGDLVKITPPGQPAHAFEYNGLNLLTAYIPPVVAGSEANRTTYEYNKAQQLTKVTRPDNKAITYGYDSAGRLVSTGYSRGAIGYAYSPTTGQINTINTPDVNLALGYKGDLLTQESWSGQVTGNVSYVYDANYRTSSISVNNAPINYQYDKDNAPILAGSLTLVYSLTSGLLESTSLGTVADSWGYNGFAETRSYTARSGATTLYQSTYDYDKLGRIISKTESISGTTSTYVYNYDAAGRLAEVKKDGTTTEIYTYDANGNRKTALGNVSATYDAQDRLLTYGNTSFAYTANGELLRKTTANQPTNYVYDEFGNLTSVTLANGETVEYLVDGLDRRVGRKVNGILQQVWLYEGSLRPVAELDGTGKLVSRFVYATRVNVPDYMIRDNVIYRFILDHLGSVRLVVNSQTGAVAQRMDYDAFGKVIQDTLPGFQPFGFAGGLYDAKTGLVRFGARDYDASVGRWTAKDPIRFAGGENLYIYVKSDPNNSIDQTGKKTTVIITYDYTFGSHAAVHIDNSGEPILYDPAGSYEPNNCDNNNPCRGTGDTLIGAAANVQDYVKHHEQQGSKVETFVFNTTVLEEAAIYANIDQRGGAAPFFCTASVSQVLSGVGPFKDLGTFYSPGNLADKLKELIKLR